MFSLDGGEGTTALADMLGAPGDLRVPALDPATALAALPYSSGTTGLPKGVMLTHRNLVANVVQTLAVCPGGDEVVAGVLPFFHIYGQTAVMNCALRAGDTVVTLPRFDFEAFLRMIAEHRVTRAFVAPPIIVALSKHPAVERYDLSSLRMINSGAAPLGDDLEAACRARVPARLQQGYGLTEASPVTHITPLARGAPAGHDRPAHPQHRGPPRQGRHARGRRIGRARRAVGARPAGDDAATSTTRPRPRGRSTADGWLRTGDIATFRAGGWRIVDRLKELIKYKGYQVAPASSRRCCSPTRRSATRA